MNLALCDDHPIYLNYLKKTIENYLLKNVGSIMLFNSAEAMLFEIGDTVPFDLVILDIQMGKMNGMDLAKKLRKIDANIFIVFITGITDYVYDGYEVGALRYLLKPLKEDELYKILDDVLEKLKSNVIRYYIFTINGEKVKINLSDIIYLEALGHYVLVHTKDQNFEIKKSLNELMKELNSDMFISVHRSFLVNIKHVEKINKDTCLLSNNEEISVSRSNYQKLNERFMMYIRGINND
ncbi:MAG: two component transcriptional regulator, LytTR family [Haloplasmataceae bacterium]|jgi:DNA-binding LytR/AlgR family response regulator|nr:two component transcriptional regulator, LytTR family [Haloplasmataceae bacterium]